ncbi:MAG: ribbon-helix-helix protein, CopG family [Hydrococcus sp. C42_A2020_068]|uniref:ribbon-helix-helix domain-containing protein n=1 Tax=Pleurocapsa sp. PCC 7327 TaxID=118163 RepID=UPI00029FE323|nr:CopG family transcriptional regulator [Pleurocapsa sp. PCC 7327]AFY78771.1 Ribbon-helix-helix protein, copG family [Pleurocapsa sp. PCC 7327]MBF2018521.1 ribbon-helix-helix protein, CopG family [Hydrococcus sp. C42_A2020_068]
MNQNRDEATLEVNVPQAWIEQFETLANQSGRSASELVREALARYLDISGQQPATSLDRLSSELKTFKAELAELTQKVNALSEKSYLITTMSARLTTLERAISLGNLKQTTTSTPCQLMDTDDDDYDDEPDEILTDFLMG